MPDTTQLVSSSLKTGTSCSLPTGSNALVNTKYMDLKVHPVQLARDHSNTFCVFYATCMRSLCTFLRQCMAQRLAVLAAELQRSWQCCWAHHLPCPAEQALPCTRLWHKLPAAMATPTCPGISCSQMLSGSCLLQASPFIAYSPDVSATSQLGHTQQLPHTCVAAFDVCIELQVWIVSVRPMYR
jgi:hypothetical protein